jgi:capsid portal protein
MEAEGPGHREGAYRDPSGADTGIGDTARELVERVTHPARKNLAKKLTQILDLTDCYRLW